MTPLAIAVLGVQLAIKIIDLRLRHYDADPELVKQDAANAVQLGKMGTMLMAAITKLFEAMEAE